VHRKTTLSHTRVQLIRVSIEVIIGLTQGQEAITEMKDTKEDLIITHLIIVTSGQHMLSNTQDVKCQGNHSNHNAQASLNLGLMDLIEDITNNHRWSSAGFSRTEVESSIPTEILTKGIDNTNRTTSRSNFIQMGSDIIKLQKAVDISKPQKGNDTSKFTRGTKSRCLIKVSLTSPINSVTCTLAHQGLNRGSSVILRGSRKIN
jgi:hypothetical protein